MLNLDYPDLLNLFSKYLDPRRTESASFLIWYLENYLRLDELEAVDCVCDKRGDKGVDGIYVNDNDMTINIFQCKISQKANSTVGDTSLKEFYGTLSQFKDHESVNNLIKSAGDSEIVRLISRLDIVNKLGTHDLRGVFISNIDIDSNGDSFLKKAPIISFVGKKELLDSYISNRRTPLTAPPTEFDISGFPISKYIVDTKTWAVIAPVRANELVNLKGIQDQSVFVFNVRGPLGRTQVNRDIVKSINNPATHKLFPLFHNGITIICEEIYETSDKITIKNYYVINGCQSLTSFYDYRFNITDDLRILTKFIKMDISSPLVEQVTRYSNNQNGVKARDFMSNNPIQIRLQNEFRQFYDGRYAFEIKRGESPGAGNIISNEDAGLYLLAFDLKEPWATHRKYMIFEEKHADIFARPEVSADRIVLSNTIIKAIEGSGNNINNKLFAKYTLTKYVILYVLRLILENDPAGKELLIKPEIFVRKLDDQSYFEECLTNIINDVIIDINAEVDEYGDDFDYRGKLRDSEWVKDLARKVVASFLKLVQRGRIESFTNAWNRKS